MEHKNYQKPAITVVRLQPTHIICTSPEPGGGETREYRGRYREEDNEW